MHRSPSSWILSCELHVSMHRLIKDPYTIFQYCEYFTVTSLMRKRVAIDAGLLACLVEVYPKLLDPQPANIVFYSKSIEILLCYPCFKVLLNCTAAFLPVWGLSFGNIEEKNWDFCKIQIGGLRVRILIQYLENNQTLSWRVPNHWDLW